MTSVIGRGAGPNEVGETYSSGRVGVDSASFSFFRLDTPGPSAADPLNTFDAQAAMDVDDSHVLKEDNDDE